MFQTKRKKVIKQDNIQQNTDINLWQQNGHTESDFSIQIKSINSVRKSTQKTYKDKDKTKNEFCTRRARMKNKFILIALLLMLIIFGTTIAYADYSSGTCDKCGNPFLEVTKVYYSLGADGHYRKARCPKCNRSYDGPSESHTLLTSWSAANCTTSGSKSVACKWCDYENTTKTSSALGHDWGAYSNSTATCTTGGSATRTCKRCNKTETITVAAKGHSWSSTYSKDTTQHWKVCTVCNALNTKENHYDTNPRNGYCDACNYAMDIVAPTATFTPTTNTTYQKTYSVKVSVADNAGGQGVNYSKCKYVWTNSSTAPTNAASFNGGTITANHATTGIATPSGKNGLWYLHVYVVDMCENSRIQSTGVFYLDNTAPTGSIKINGGALYTDTATVTLNISAKDSASGITQMAISNTSTKGAYETYTTSKAWTLTTGDGNKTVYIWFKDQAGNESSAYTASILYDTTAPSNAGTMATTPTITTIIASISGAKDTTSGIKNYDYYFNGTLKASNQPATYTYTGLTPNTWYTLNHAVRDNVNKTTKGADKTECTLAAIPNNIVASNGTSNNQITITWGNNNNPNNTKYFVEYSEDGKNWTPLNTTGVTTLTYTHSGLTKNKTYQYRVYAQNDKGINTHPSIVATGKTTQETIYDSIILDTTAPVANFNKNRIDGFDGTRIDTSFKVDVIEAYEINVLKYMWTTTNTKLTTESQFTDGTFISGQSIEPPARIVGGTCYLQVYMSDAAGNVRISVSEAYNKLLSVSNPSIIINNNALYTNNTNLKLTLSAENAKYMYISEEVVPGDSIGDSLWSTYATSKNYTLKSTINGERTVYAYYKDLYGNVVIASDTIIFDNVSPEVGNITGYQYKNTNSGGTVSVTAKDFNDFTGSGIKDCRWSYKIGNGAWTTGAWTATTTTSTYNMPVTVEGTYTVRIELRDNADNIGTIETTVMIDRTPPVIGTLTSPIVTNASSGTIINIIAQNLSDSASGIDSCVWEYKKGAGSYVTIKTETLKDNTSNCDVTIAEENIYTIRITLKDKAGNTSYKETTIDVDRRAPTLGTLNMTSTVNTITATVTGATAAKGTIAGYEFYIDGEFKVRQASNVYTFTNLDCTTGYNITYKVYDNYGNITAMSQNNIKFTLAKVPTNIVASDKEFSNKIEVTWDPNGNTLDASINNSGQIVKVTYEVQASDDNITYTSIYTGSDLSCVHKNLGMDTTKYYKVRAINQEGIRTAFSSVITGATVNDTFPPNVGFKSAENITMGLRDLAKKTDVVEIVLEVEEENWNTSILTPDDISVYIVKENDEDGLLDFRDNKINPQIQIVETKQTETGAEITIRITNITDDGSIILGVAADKIIDKNGNKNEEKYFDIEMKADNTMPDMGIERDPNVWTKGNVTLDIITRDKNKDLTLTVDGQTIEVIEDIGTYIATERKEYTIISTDRVGNKNEKTYMVDNIDRDSPIKVTLTSEASESGGTTLKGTATDELSGIKYYTFTTSKEEPTEWIEVSVRKDLEREIIMIIDGEYYFWVKDQVGNTAVSTPATVTTTKSSMITNWTIPANANGAGLGSTIKLPIPTSKTNHYIVDWGDGTTAIYTVENFPEHTYKNTAEQTYKVRIIGTVNTFGYYADMIPTSSNSYSSYYTFTKYLTGIEKWGELNLTRVGFAHCTNLAGTIPEAEGFRNLTSLENMFYNCSKLTGPIPEMFLADTFEVTSARNMFKNCTSLQGEIPTYLFNINRKLLTLEGAFSNCTNLSGSIAETLFVNLENIENYAETFSNCKNLTGEIPEALLEAGNHVNNYYRMFYNCTGLTGEITEKLLKNNIVIDNASNIGYSDFRGMFENCTGLTKVKLSTVVIGKEMFKNCTGITNIELTKAVDIADEAFYACNKLTTIKASGEYLKTIGKDAFEYTGTNPALLKTLINKDNEILVKYIWLSDNRLVDIVAPRGTVEIITPKYPFTKQEEVTLKITVTDDFSKPEDCTMAIVNDVDYDEMVIINDYSNLVWQPYKAEVTWNLTPYDGIKTVYVLFKDESENIGVIKENVMF